MTQSVYSSPLSSLNLISTIASFPFSFCFSLRLNLQKKLALELSLVSHTCQNKRFESVANRTNKTLLRKQRNWLNYKFWVIRSRSEHTFRPTRTSLNSLLSAFHQEILQTSCIIVCIEHVLEQLPAAPAVTKTLQDEITMFISNWKDVHWAQGILGQLQSWENCGDSWKKVQISIRPLSRGWPRRGQAVVP